MKRVLLDTNVYGLIVEKEDPEKVREIIRNSSIIIYGIAIIRKELRATPKGIIDGINLRMDLLRLYQETTKDRELEIGKKEVEITENYSVVYKKLGGITSKEKMMNDFLIVASASLHNIDIVVSEDNTTMLNKTALSAYSIVNSVLKLRMPRFISYDKFKQEIR